MLWHEFMMGIAIQITTQRRLEDYRKREPYFTFPFPLQFPSDHVQASLISPVPRGVHSAKYSVLVGEGP